MMKYQRKLKANTYWMLGTREVFTRLKTLLRNYYTLQFSSKLLLKRQ